VWKIVIINSFKIELVGIAFHAFSANTNYSQFDIIHGKFVKCNGELETGVNRKENSQISAFPKNNFSLLNFFCKVFSFFF
jgi:diaminopimelate decarboxylase